MKNLPVTVVRSLELLGLFLIGAVIVIGKTIIMPLLLAFFLSLMLMPVFRLLRRFKLPEPVAIFLSILFLSLFVALTIWLFASQVSSLASDYPQIEKNVTLHLTNLSTWISNKFGYSPKDQIKFINDNSNKLFNSAGIIMKQTANSVSSVLLFSMLLPLFIFLIIVYRGLLTKFALMWFAPEESKNVKEVVSQVESIIMSYLIGLLIQIIYIIILLGLTLMIVGIKHGLLIGIMFAILNLVPYLGPLIGNILGALITLSSSESLKDVLIVIVVIGIVQFLDNNILMPIIVGSKVRINALVSIVGIFIGGMLAGISGMFLAMPVIAVLKISFDHSPKFAKWGVLLGDEKQYKNEQRIPMLIQKLKR